MPSWAETAGQRLPKEERYIETPDAAVYGGENVACAVEASRAVPSCGGNLQLCAIGGCLRLSFWVERRIL